MLQITALLLSCLPSGRKVCGFGGRKFTWSTLMSSCPRGWRQSPMKSFFPGVVFNLGGRFWGDRISLSSMKKAPRIRRSRPGAYRPNTHGCFSNAILPIIIVCQLDVGKVRSFVVPRIVSVAGCSEVLLPFFVSLPAGVRRSRILSNLSQSHYSRYQADYAATLVLKLLDWQVSGALAGML